MNRKRTFDLFLQTSVLLALLVACVFGSSSKDDDVVRARSFELLDDEGSVTAALRQTVAGPRLSFFDSEGRRRIVLGMQASAPGLEILGERGSHRIQVRDLNGSPIVELHDDIGHGRLRMTIGSRGPKVQLLDETGDVVDTWPNSSAHRDDSRDAALPGS